MLELVGVSGGYGDTVVVRDVSLSVPDGGVAALLGPNGAGKSTTLRLTSGLLKPRSGRVVLDGEDVTGLGPTLRTRRGLCHLPEGRGVFPGLTVAENLRLYSPKGRESESFALAVDAFPVLGERRRQVAGTLSGGEQQMLSLARAYVSKPRYVLVDEASLGLAPLVVDAIFEFLHRLAADGVSLLIVEQYVNRALALATTVYVLHKGEIVHAGPAKDLTEDAVFALYSGELEGAV